MNEGQQARLKGLAEQIETAWQIDYVEQKCESAARRKPRLLPSYKTTEFIQQASDRDLMKHMGVPARFINQYPDLPDEVLDWLDLIQYTHRPTWERHDGRPSLGGLGMLFYGPSGSGKTTVACELLRVMVRLGKRNTDPDLVDLSMSHGWSMGRFVSWQDASETFRTAAGGNEDAQEEAETLKHSMYGISNSLDTANYLLIDDISRERSTEWNLGELQRILRFRHEHELTTILTTNHKPDDWGKYYGEVFPGFLHRAFVPVEFKEYRRAGQ